MELYDELSDGELADLLRGGEARALRALYDRHLRQLHYFILRTAKSRTLTEDVVHDVFIRIWETRSQINPSLPFKSYLYAIAKRHLFNVLKRAQHETFILEEIRKYTVPSENTTDLLLDLKEGNALLNEAIEKLPKQCKAVFILCKIQGMTYKQVAEELGITEGTVNSQMVKALRSIKKYISLKNAFSLLLLYFLKH